MNRYDVILPRQPHPPDDWVGGHDVRHIMKSVYPAQAFLHRPTKIQVISAVEVASDADQIQRGPEYHLSLSRFQGEGAQPTRCSADEAAWVLAQFGLDGWEEDNHVPHGVVRNFWRPVAERFVGMDCVCKQDEPVVREGDFEYRPLE